MFSVRPCLGTNSWICEWLSFTLVNLTSASCLYIKMLTLNLRFPKGDMEKLCDTLQLPANYISSQGTIPTGMESVMILLRGLAFANQWSDVVTVFGRTISELSLIFNKVKLLLCLFIFPVEVACIPLSFYHSRILLGGVESLAVHFVFVCLIFVCF